MAAEIELITFAERNVTPTDDAVLYEVAVGESGVIYGCSVTMQSANTLHVAAGHGVLCGRKFTAFECNVPVTLSSSGSKLGRIYVHMDLSNTSQPISLEVEVADELTPEVHDENVNIINGTWDMNLATFDVNELTIANVVNVFPAVSGGGSNMIAENENGSTASQAYSKGEYVNWKGNLYEVIAAIAQGDQFVLGTNLSASDTTVGAELTGLNSSLSALRPVLLWTNPSPSSDFTPGDVVIDLSGYTFVEIYYCSVKSVNYLLCSKVPVGEIAHMTHAITSSIAARGAYARERLATTSATGIHFSNASEGYTGQAGTINNACCIPYKIYGYK